MTDSHNEAARRGEPGAGAEPAEGKRVFKVLQGYIWHPRQDDVDLGDYLPERLDPDIHVLWDPLPRAPFTFFDDGTLAETQTVYQFTVLAFTESDATPEPLVPWLAEILQDKLDQTPAGVGWQIMEDLRELAR